MYIHNQSFDSQVFDRKFTKIKSFLLLIIVPLHSPSKISILMLPNFSIKQDVMQWPLEADCIANSSLAPW